jgi:hypothetical protein
MGDRMSKSEANVQALGRMAASKSGAVTFRNSVGGAWSGRKVKTLPNGNAIIAGAQWIKFGLQVGSADTLGWKSITITPEMVGKKVAVFSSIEYKTDTGKPSPDQIGWHNAVWNAGGYSGFARCDDDVRDILNGVKIDP